MVSEGSRFLGLVYPKEPEEKNGKPIISCHMEIFPHGFIFTTLEFHKYCLDVDTCVWDFWTQKNVSEENLHIVST